MIYFSIWGLGILILEIIIRVYSRWDEGIYSTLSDKQNSNKDILFIITILTLSWISVIILVGFTLYSYLRYLKLIKTWINDNLFLIHEYLNTDNINIKKDLQISLLQYMELNKVDGSYSPHTFKTLLKDKITIEYSNKNPIFNYKK